MHDLTYFHARERQADLRRRARQERRVRRARTLGKQDQWR